MTGRSDVAISAQDYKFYSPRHKYRRATSTSASSMPGLPVSLFTLNDLLVFSEFNFSLFISKDILLPIVILRRKAENNVAFCNHINFQPFPGADNTSTMATSQGYCSLNEVRTSLY